MTANRISSAIQSQELSIELQSPFYAALPSREATDAVPGLPLLSSYPSQTFQKRFDQADLLPRVSNINSTYLKLDEEKEEPEGGASVGSAVFNLTTTIVGAGIMALPATMKVLGLPLGVVLIFFMGIVSEVSIEIVVFFTSQMKVWSYGDMVGGACGWAGRMVAQLCIIINNSGILIVYLIIMGEVLSGSPHHMGLLEQWAGREGWWNDRALVLLVLMVLVLAPISALKKIDSLKFTSALSVALAVLFVLLSSGIALVKALEGHLEKPQLVPSFSSKRSILDLLTVIPIMTNAYICHFNIQPIYYELKNRSATRMNRVGRISTVVCVTVYMATAVSGYLLFGEATASDVLTNFDKNLGISYSALLNNVIRIGYVIHLMLVFPVIHFSLRQTIDSCLFPRASPLVHSKFRFFGWTFTLLSLVFLGSTVIPNIWIAFQFTGATSGLSLGFIFPALVILRAQTQQSELGSWARPFAWMMVVIAIIASLLGVSTNIYNVITRQE
ncbi:hypothetical protein O6H91_08G033900 [Diphasiastrum complanatum]|uniref:Uncharacterized protein n=1 Tax=Diphasiastrum complanatum TaxID=34168 RepID=A0ACC2CWE4_DIPCM|nr:hypothetical protein O6H91_08G033900 [Diphasiastrum complanatum]